MTECPDAIRLLIELWRTDDRFMPEGVRTAVRNPAEWPDYTWDGGVTQGGQSVDLELFHNWTKIDQQAMLEAAVGKILSLMSTYPATVVQIQDNQVSVKHVRLGEVRKFKSHRTMVGNLFNAIKKLVEVEWLPMLQSKAGDYYYTEEERTLADQRYQLKVLTESKAMLEKDIKRGSLPANDPFVDVPFLMTGPHGEEIETMQAKIREIESQLQTLRESIKQKEAASHGHH